MGCGSSETMAAPEAKATESEYVPCNFEYEKSVFFRKLDPETTGADMAKILSKFGPLDYCYVAQNKGVSKKIGRAKFRAQGHADDRTLAKDQAITTARNRAIANADAAVTAIDNKLEVGGKIIRCEKSRPADLIEYTRYGDY